MPQRCSPWLFTFADLAALLLAFFVLTFSMSRLDAERWRTLSALWRTEVPTASESARTRSRLSHSAPDPRPEPAVGEASYLARVLDRRLGALDRPYGLRATAAGGTVVLRFAPRLLTGRTAGEGGDLAELRAILLPALSDLAETRLLIPVPSDAPLADRLHRLERLGEAAGRRFGRIPDLVLAAPSDGPAKLVLVP